MRPGHAAPATPCSGPEDRGYPTHKEVTLLRKYEILYILRHDSPADVTQTAIEKVKTTIGEQGGTILLHESWGKKKLAYEIGKAQKGIYQLTTFASEPTSIKEIEHVLRIHPEVMKWLTVQLNEHILDLNVEVEHYSKITPKMVPIDGEESAPVHEEPYAHDSRKNVRPEVNDDDDDDEEGGEGGDEGARDAREGSAEEAEE
jgi:small subunit ribosomal protein S6